jgi:hypothetical protein
MRVGGARVGGLRDGDARWVCRDGGACMQILNRGGDNDIEVTAEAITCQ